MNHFVTDASVAIKWLIWEEGTERAHKLLDQIEFFYVPNLFLMEIDAVITKRVRKKEMTGVEALIKREQFRKFPFEQISYKEIEELAFELSIGFPITLYDAAYLATAIDHQAKLYTADHRLANGLSGTPFSEYVECILD